MINRVVYDDEMTLDCIRSLLSWSEYFLAKSKKRRQPRKIIPIQKYTKSATNKKYAHHWKAIK